MCFLPLHLLSLAFTTTLPTSGTFLQSNVPETPGTPTRTLLWVQRSFFLLSSLIPGSRSSTHCLSLWRPPLWLCLRQFCYTLGSHLDLVSSLPETNLFPRIFGGLSPGTYLWPVHRLGGPTSEPICDRTPILTPWPLSHPDYFDRSFKGVSRI